LHGIAFAWSKYDDKLLGKQYRPECTVEIKTRDGKWKSRVLKVDSSADTILMDEKNCQDLGYTFTDCISNSYHDINKNYVTCYIRKFDIKVGDIIIKNVPISFSTTPIADLLLGRSKIFDTLYILFDSKNKQTIFATQL
jgi:hypothetical protein